MEHSIEPADIQAAWNRNQQRVFHIQQTTGRNAAEAAREVERLRSLLAQAEATVQQAEADLARELTEPTIHLAGLRALCDANKIPHPQDPPLPPVDDNPLGIPLEPAPQATSEQAMPAQTTAARWVAGTRDTGPERRRQ